MTKEPLVKALESIMDGPDRPLNYCKGYAKYALYLIEIEAPISALHHQLLYVISNTQSWRGEVARQAKAVIREYVKNFGRMAG